MSYNYSVTVRERTSGGKSLGYEGVVNIPGVRPAKLERRDGGTLFQTPSAISSAVRSLCSKTSLDFELISTSTQKQAAKTNTSKKTRTTSKKWGKKN